MEVSFRAQVINKCNIQKYNAVTQKYSPHEVSFIKLDSENWRDKRALKKLSKSWKDSFAKNICKNMKRKKDSNFYALTEQNSNFDKIDFKKILGISQVSNEEPNVYCIDYLQSCPDYSMNIHDRKYKKIGKTILENFKNLFRKDTIKLSPIYEDDVIDFYLSNNFKFEKFYLGNLIWIDKFEKNNL